MTSLRKATFEDEEGRKKAVFLPEEASDDDVSKGVPIGPPNLEELDLPLDIEVRLNNELFARGILTSNDALKRRTEVLAALQAALKVDVGRVVDIYIGKENPNGKDESTEEQPNKTVFNRRRRGASERSDVPSPEQSSGSELAPGGSDSDQDS